MNNLELIPRSIVLTGEMIKSSLKVLSNDSYQGSKEDTDDRKRPTRPVEADSIVVKTLRTVLYSFRDGVSLKLKKKNGRPDSLKISIDWYHFQPLSPVV